MFPNNRGPRSEVRMWLQKIDIFILFSIKTGKFCALSVKQVGRQSVN